MIKIQKLGIFDRMYEELVVLDPQLKPVVLERVERFQKNPNDTRLDNHPLTKRMKGKWAFSITDDIRIVYEWLGKTTVRFLAIGSHPRVYPAAKPS